MSIEEQIASVRKTALFALLDSMALLYANANPDSNISDNVKFIPASSMNNSAKGR